VFEPEELGQRKDELAAGLRDARRAAGLTGARLAARCGISQSKISKIETGKVLATATDVERMLTALGTSQDQITELLALARLANTEFQSTRASLRRGLHYKQKELAAFEAETQHLRFFLPLMITGLLQTPEYARASMVSFPGDHQQAIARRLERQSALYNPARRFTFILTEAAVRWQLCDPRVMAVQADRLASLSELPNVTIGVIPLDSRVADGPLNTFTVYDERIATAETFTGVIMMRDPRDVAYHLELFAFFQRYAVTGDAVRALLGSYAQRFRDLAAAPPLFAYWNDLTTAITGWPGPARSAGPAVLSARHGPACAQRRRSRARPSSVSDPCSRRRAMPPSGKTSSRACVTGWSLASRNRCGVSGTRGVAGSRSTHCDSLAAAGASESMPRSRAAPGQLPM
jgi:transcriptional regulator with XRE-family HTH domain